MHFESILFSKVGEFYSRKLELKKKLWKNFWVVDQQMIEKNGTCVVYKKNTQNSTHNTLNSIEDGFFFSLASNELWAENASSETEWRGPTENY